MTDADTEATRHAWLDTLYTRGSWRSEAEVRRRELASRLDAVAAPPASAASPPSSWEDEAIVAGRGVLVRVTVEEGADEGPETNPAARDAHVKAACTALQDAADAIGSGHRLRSWWTGSAVTVAWESVHAAAGELVAIEPADAVRVGLPHLRDWVAEVMPQGTARDRYTQKLDDMIDRKTALDRTLVRQAHRDALQANNERHANLRTLRNLLLGTSAGLTILLLAIAVWHAINPVFVSLCGPSDVSPKCFSDDQPAAIDVFAVELVGAAAGLLSIAFAIVSEATPPSRYNVGAAQAALKPAAGAATALIGVLLLQSQLIVSPATNITKSTALAYAAIFGFSQQLLTQFVDKRADKLLQGEKDTKT